MKYHLKETEKKITAAFSLCLLALGIIFIFRQFYGFNKNDEIYYLSMTRRFVQGDGMLVDEWNNGQLFTFLLYPFVWIVTHILGGTEGIVLAARISFVLFQAAVACASFYLMKEQGLPAAVCGIAYFVFTPFNISAFSYNTLVLAFLYLIFSAVASGRQRGKRGWIFLGILTAFTVLANPYTLILYLLYGLLCIGNTICRKQKTGVVCWRSLVWLTVGAGLVLIVFLIFVFSRGSLQEILQSLDPIINDAERQKPVWEKTLKYAERMWRYYGGMLCMAAVCGFLFFLDKKRRIPGWLYMSAAGLVTAAYILYYGLVWDHVPMNFIQVPISFLGLAAYMTNPERKKRVFIYWYLPVLFFTYLMHMAADTGILAVSSAYWLVSAASVYLLWDHLKTWKRSSAACMLFLCVCSLQILTTSRLRVIYVWGDDPLPALTARMEEGPMKGIYTTKENQELYTETLSDIQSLGLTKDDRLLVAGLAPWIYLDVDARVASYTTWEIPVQENLLARYYEQAHEMPDLVYIPELIEEPLETKLAKYFTEAGYTSIEMKRGVAMLRNNTDTTGGKLSGNAV